MNEKKWLMEVQVNLFQKHFFLHQLTHNMTSTVHENCKLRTYSEHAQNMLCMYINSSECQNKNNLCTQHVLSMFWACNIHVQNSRFNEDSAVILWVSWCKNKSFWQRFTCSKYRAGHDLLAGFCSLSSKIGEYNDLEKFEYQNTKKIDPGRNAKYCIVTCWLLHIDITSLVSLCIR